MPRLVAIGASAGGFDALLMLLQHLPRAGRLCVAIVLHMPQEHHSTLPELFAARTAAQVREAQAHAPLEAGGVYIAPPGYHLLVEADQTFSLSCDPPVHFSRPSIDVLFESCADAFGSDAAAIVLTGANEDGARGLARIVAAGGVAVVQDPRDAQHPTMPLAALRQVRPHAVLPLAGIARLLQTWSRN
jgi:two-component system chemotaxis response regulator CheB